MGKLRRSNLKLRDKLRDLSKCNFCYLARDTPVIYEGEFFYVIPSVGPIAQNHILVVTYEHVTSLSEFLVKYSNSIEELVDIIGKIYILADNAKTLLFEHGRTAQSVNHTHLHIIWPFEEDLFNKFVIKIKNDFGEPTIFNIMLTSKEVLQIFKSLAGSQYLFISYFFKKILVLVWKNIEPPGQYLRRIAAQVTNKTHDDYDWRKNPKINETIYMGNYLRRKWLNLFGGHFVD